MASFKAFLPADLSDPSSLGRIRGCTLLPLATAALICRQYGRSPASIAWLRAFAQPVGTRFLHEQAEENAANRKVDLVLMDQLDDQSFEVEDLSFRQELTSMPVFQRVADDEERLKTYILNAELCPHTRVSLCKHRDTAPVTRDWYLPTLSTVQCTL